MMPPPRVLLVLCLVYRLFKTRWIERVSHPTGGDAMWSVFVETKVHTFMMVQGLWSAWTKPSLAWSWFELCLSHDVRIEEGASLNYSRCDRIYSHWLLIKRKFEGMKNLHCRFAYHHTMERVSQRRTWCNDSSYVHQINHACVKYSIESRSILPLTLSPNWRRIKCKNRTHT